MHPTVKPVTMVADAIKDCSRRGDIVLDPFAGSGTTIVAAQKTGRRAFAMEIEPRFIDTAVRRWQECTGKEAVHSETGGSFARVEEQRLSTIDANANLTKANDVH
jgi:DNA modification methylase